MDDNQFDDIIKKKISQYEEPGFDPASLAGLHYRMAAADTVWPWYSRYRTEFFISAGLILCTLIILWSQWSLNTRVNTLLNNSLQTSRNQDEQISKLQSEIAYLRNIQPDTIRIIESREQNSAHYVSLLDRISELEATLESYLSKSPHSPTLSRADVLESQSEFTGTMANKHRISFSGRSVRRRMEKQSARVRRNSKNIAVKSQEEVSLSVKAMRDIEKHYQKGIGVQIGPALEFSKGIYSMGNGRIDFAGGLLAEFILSPSLSLETGGKFALRVYQVSDQGDFSKIRFPHTDESLGMPKSADIDSWILEVPVNLKYRHPISLRKHWLAGIGFSPMLFTKQVFEYDYQLNGNSSASIYSIYNNKKPELYSGALNFSLGLSNEIKRKNIVETSVYYQQGLGAMGVENIRRSFIGVRGIYWFKIK